MRTIPVPRLPRRAPPWPSHRTQGLRSLRPSCLPRAAQPLIGFACLLYAPATQPAVLTFREWCRVACAPVGFVGTRLHARVARVCGGPLPLASGGFSIMGTTPMDTRDAVSPPWHCCGSVSLRTWAWVAPDMPRRGATGGCSPSRVSCVALLGPSLPLDCDHARSLRYLREQLCRRLCPPRRPWEQGKEVRPGQRG